MDTLESMLLSHDAAVRARAAEQCARSPEQARREAAALVRAVTDPDPAVRDWLTSALEDMGPPDPRQAAELAALLSDGQGDTAYWAATLLGRLDDAATIAVAALAAALGQHPQPAVRERAAWALGRIGPASARAEAALQAAAASDSPRLARLADEALQRIRS